MRTYPSVNVFIQKLDRTIRLEKLSVLCLPDKPTLESVRNVLQDGPLGHVDKDIFFPSWTRSIHVLLLDPNPDQAPTPTWEHIEENKITVEDTDKLLEILAMEEESPGSTSIILQECRSKRYTRKKENFSALPFESSPVSSPLSSRPTSPKAPSRPSTGHPKHHRRQQVHQTAPPYHQEMYSMYNTPTPTYDPGYYYDPYVPVGIIAPPSIYPPFYPFQVGMGCYNYAAPPPFVPQMYPANPVYYGYGVM